MDQLNIGIIIGTTRPGRFSEKPAHWIWELAKHMENMNAELLDLRDYPMPFYNEAKTPSELAPHELKDETARKWAMKIDDMDGFIVVTAEYNHGYPAVLKNALDTVYSAWNRKPVGFVSYGGVSGARSVEQLRNVVIELQMVPLRTALHIPPQIKKEAATDPQALDALNDRANAFLDQIHWWSKLLKQARK